MSELKRYHLVRGVWQVHKNGEVVLYEDADTEIKSLMNTIEKLTVSNEQLEQENNKIRGLLAQGKGDCVYCGLPAADIAKCPSGFPGCARMDDIVNAPETIREKENAALHILVMGAKNIILAYVCGHMTVELTKKAEAWLQEVTDGRKPETAL